MNTSYLLLKISGIATGFSCAFRRVCRTDTVAFFATVAVFATMPPSVGEALNHDPSGIPWAELRARAEADYHGDGLSISHTEDGAILNAVFQRLRAEATPQGLWLTSTADEGNAGRFRVVATSVGRAKVETLGCADMSALSMGRNVARIQSGDMSPHSKYAFSLPSPMERLGLEPSGQIATDGSLVRYVRAGLVEEYSTGMDGVRQDFLVIERPAGDGELFVELAVDGATAAPAAYGARLTLDGSARRIAYSRLYVEDAKGRELPARMEVASADRLAITVNDAGAAYPVRIDPTFSDENWVGTGATFDDDVAAVAVSNGVVYVGGHFTSAGGSPGDRVARWDGTNWSSLGQGIDNNSVRALVVDDSGNLYAGGDFINVGGVANARRIVKWDGEAWHPLGNGIGNNIVWALTLDTNGHLYAGGSFTSAGGVTSRNRVARWDGEEWFPLGDGIANGTVHALVFDTQGTLFAGGTFTEGNGSPGNRIARWDGNDWAPVGGGMNGTVRALAADDSGNLYAAGGFTSPASRIARWDGNAWHPLGAGIGNNLVYAVTLDSTGNLFAGGSFTSAGGVTNRNRIAKWDGEEWFPLGSGIEGGIVLALDADGSGVYAGGSFTTAGGEPYAFFAKAEMGESAPPETQHSLAGTAGDNGWFTGSVEVTLSATDFSGAGIDETFYQIDGGPAQTYTGSFVLSDEGQTAIEYWSVDNAGNAESPVGASISIDSTAPDIANFAAVQGQEAGPVDLFAAGAIAHQGTIVVIVEVFDATSGIADEDVVLVLVHQDLPESLSAGAPETETTVVGGETWTRYLFEVEIDALSVNGIYDAAVQAHDLAGNESAMLTGTIEVNKNQIETIVQLQGAAAESIEREVVFTATDADGAVLATWTREVEFVPVEIDGVPVNGFGSQTVRPLPEETAFLSAKTSFSLRRRMPVLLEPNGQAMIDFSGENSLLGGDLDGDNLVGMFDFVVLRSHWLTDNDVADITGDGTTNQADLNILSANWLVRGDDP